MYNAERRVGTISVISSTPIIPMLVLRRYTRVLLRPRTAGGGLPAMLFLKRPISD